MSTETTEKQQKQSKPDFIETVEAEKTDNRSFGEKVAQVVFKPNTMKSIARDPKIMEAIFLFALFLVISISSINMQFNKLIYRWEGSPRPVVESDPHLITFLIVLFLFLLIGTGILHVISLILYDGKGSFYPQMMVIVGYGLIPSIIVGIIGNVILSCMAPIVITMEITDPIAYLLG